MHVEDQQEGSPLGKAAGLRAVHGPVGALSQPHPLPVPHQASTTVGSASLLGRSTCRQMRDRMCSAWSSPSCLPLPSPSLTQFLISPFLLQSSCPQITKFTHLQPAILSGEPGIQLRLLTLPLLPSWQLENAGRL